MPTAVGVQLRAMRSRDFLAKIRIEHGMHLNNGPGGAH
jgi:hypothetical protein